MEDIRVEDYLDDKLQSTTDFEELDTLISSVEYQRSQLQSQLDDASRELDEARKSSEERGAALVAQIDEFQTLQKSIDVRLQIIAESDAPDEAIRRLEPPMKQLHKVDLAYRYLSLLWDEMKETMWDELESVLAKRGWPNVDPDTDVDDDWLQCFEKLVDLQAPEVLYSPSTVSLLPVDVMSQIFIKEFRFHFLSDKPTSSPQVITAHCFPWFLALVEKWEDFLRDNFGSALAAKFGDTNVAHKIVYMDPVCAFITSLLPVMREKIALTISETSGDTVFLSSLLSQLMTFDERLSSGFAYDGGGPEEEWGGLTSEVLSQHFRTWLDAEKKFALERYQAIMTAPDARNIDYDFAATGKTKPTFAAVRVTDLLRSVTTQYERVKRFSHKLRFLIDIQLTILDEYHDHLRGTLEAYLSITSTVGRAFGVTKEQLAALEGTGALETLCKVYGSADQIVNTLRDWSNEEFFVTLWEQLQTRAKVTEDQTNLAGGMSYDHVRDKTSAAVGKENDDNGILFDETIAAYSQRRKRAEEFISEALVETHRKVFKAYLHRPQWSTIADDASGDIAVTAELDEPLRVNIPFVSGGTLANQRQILKRDLDFLQRALGTAAFRRVWREALEQLNNTLWGEVLMSHRFTASGAAQFSRDLHAISALVERFIPDGSSSLGSVSDALRLLNLPIEAPEGGMSLRRATDMVYTGQHGGEESFWTSWRSTC
ncbi:hypothetical protein CHGG_09656 [Chaetomium globosum CBS 148.51]|uniref:RAD50-interacting protein 1 n=1 Tax=Chaetomium globosum (strain ATCC 6205 / CBS 148.51 / DSM 1962 / NBRC 6347 / NRRL 1970) TaxID=306901 RepID=Q2GQU8_CHAGB|nr:uncharacterized protein CHGG_09656 [Chaetomium globosum CBS 148.51]EAQ83252.1 hypothetical protein CHGG_09656 [Chaetomium globosum CBS 148.51]